MLTLLRIELRKLLPYRAFWGIMGIYIIVMLMLVYSSSSVQVNGKPLGSSLYSFPGIWMKLSFIGSFFNLLLGILIMMLITDEFSFRTLRQQVIDGLSKLEFVQAKITVVVLIALVSSIFLFFTGLGFGLYYASPQGNVSALQDATYVVYYFVQAIGYMALALLFGVIFRKSTLAIISFLIYTIAIEPLIHLKMPDNIDKYLPMKVLSALTPNPTREVMDTVTGSVTELLLPKEALLPGGFYILLFCVLAYLVLKKRDL